ncbi:MAG: SDR family oxidoreductase [Phycisphaerales bacterium]
MASELLSRIAIVTGASAGIGLASAKRLVEAGARVIVNARRADRLHALCAELNRGRPEPRAAAVAGDCSTPDTIAAMLAGARRNFGAPADLVLVNAGRGLRGSVLDSDVQQWEEVIRTNVLGAARLLRAAAAEMLESLAADAAGGTAWTARPRDLIVIGSVVGRNVSPFSSMYGSTKFAIQAVAEGLRRELGPKGIRVSMLAPGFVVSEFQGVAGYDPAWFRGVLEKLGPALDPDDVARTVAFIASQPAHVHLGDVLLRPTRQDYP